jgi:hypothetical protein
MANQASSEAGCNSVSGKYNWWLCEGRGGYMLECLRLKDIVAKVRQVAG